LTFSATRALTSLEIALEHDPILRIGPRSRLSFVDAFSAPNRKSTSAENALEHCVPMTFVSTTKPATKTPAAKGGTTR
jgi:hypothetical protein